MTDSTIRPGLSRLARRAAAGARWLCVATLLGACGSRPPPPPQQQAGGAALPVASPGPPEAGSSNPVAVDPAEGKRLPCKEAIPSSPLFAERAAAIDALFADHAAEAVAKLSEIVRQRPQDLAAEILRRASQSKLGRANASAGDEVSDVRITQLEALPLVRTLVAEAPVPPNASVVRLTLDTQKKNLIVDNEDWFKNNGLAHPVGRGGTDPLPDHVAATFRKARLRGLYPHPDHHVAFYGSVLVASASGKKPLVFDASRAMAAGGHRLDVDYAQLMGSTLVVALAVNGYAKEVGGKTGYVAAFDAKSGRLLWSSDPLTSNLGNFVVAGRSIIAGYGFTAEPDFLFVLDAAKGTSEQKIPLKSGPEAIVAKGDRVFVRTYDTDYVFRAAAPLPAALPADLPAAEAEVAFARPEARCWAGVAAAAIDRRDTTALAEALREMRHYPSERFLDDGLHAALEFLEGQTRGPRKIDLTTTAPIVLAAPPWAYAAPGARPPPDGRPPRLTLVQKRNADPVRALAPKTFRADRPFLLAPVARGALPAGAPQDIPSSYGMEDLRAILPSPDRMLLVYGGRYLAVLKDGTTERIFDMDAFRHPPSPNPQWKEFAVEDVTGAIAEDGTVYVCNGGGSYAKEVNGKKGFVSALDLATGRLLWRSDALVCNSPLVTTGEYLLSGYGFTAEPDFLFILRKSDGKTMSRTPVDSGPEEIRLEGTRLAVETYDRSYLFELR